MNRSPHADLTRRLALDRHFWLAAKAGVEHFSDAIAAIVSLTGFVQGETIAALILHAVDDEDRSRSGAPRETPQQVPIMSLQEQQTTGDPRDLLRMTIRRLNYQLLQLARPECLPAPGLAASSAPDSRAWGLPREYLSEYIERQEHFSVASLMRAEFRAHRSQVRSGRQHARKLVVFTRTDAGVARLGSGVDALLSLLCEKNATDFGLWSSLTLTLQLRNVASSTELAQRIQDFIRGGVAGVPRFLLVLADTTVVSASQINCARHEVLYGIVERSCLASVLCLCALPLLCRSTSP